MKIELNKGELTLKEGFTMEVKKTNPFFSDEGSYTFPSEIPATPENLTILGNPERPTRSTRFVRKFTALLKGPFMQKRCTLLATGLSKSSGVNVSLLLDESETFSALKKRSMREVFSSKAITVGASKSDYMSALEFLWTIYTQDSSNPYSSFYLSAFPELTVFPVVVKDGELYHFLNEVNSSKNGFVYQGREILQKSDGTEKVTVPDYYGITPFLKLSYVARAIFELSGYEVEQNDLESSILSQLVLLNNCSDTYLSAEGTYPIASYSDLVPDVTVGDFLAFLKDKFGVGVFISGNRVRLRIREGCLMLDSGYNPDLDLSEYVIGDAEISFPEAKKLTIAVKTSIEGAEPIAETMEKFQKENSAASDLLDVDEGTGIYTRYSDDTKKTVVKSGSDAFKFDRTVDGIDESEDISTGDEFVPMVRMPDGNCYPFVGERINLHTSVNGKEESQEQVIIVCHAPFSGGKFSGTTRSYRRNAGTLPRPRWVTVPALTPEGLYSSTHERYGAMLMSAAPEFKVRASLPTSSVLNLRLDLPKCFMGTMVVITALSYKLDDNGVRDLELNLRRISGFTDEINLPEIKIQKKYYWKLVNTLPKDFNPANYNSVAYDGLTDYTMGNAPQYSPQYDGQIALRRSRWVSAKYKRHTGFMKWEWGNFSSNYEEYFIGVSYAE